MPKRPGGAVEKVPYGTHRRDLGTRSNSKAGGEPGGGWGDAYRRINKKCHRLNQAGKCLNPELTDIPEAWLSWPCIGYFFEDALPNHWQELVALGNIDNESLALQVSFVDKLTKLRELLLLTFTSVENYKTDRSRVKVQEEGHYCIGQDRIV